MPVQQAKDVIEISIEVKYRKAGWISTHEGVVPKSVDSEIKNDLERLLIVVRKAKEKEKKHQSFLGKIESEIVSVVSNIEKIKEPKELLRGEKAEKFKQDVKNGEQHVCSCMPEKKCLFFKKSKPPLSVEQLQRLANSLEGFSKAILSAQEGNTGINGVSAPVVSYGNGMEQGSSSGKGVSSTSRSSPVQASGESGQNRKAAISKSVPKKSDAMPLAVKDIQKHDSPNLGGKDGFMLNNVTSSAVNEKLIPTQKKTAVPNNFTSSSIPVPPKPSSYVAGLDTSKELKKGNDAAIAVATPAMPNNVTSSTISVPHNHIAGLDLSRESKEKDAATIAAASAMPNSITHSTISVPPKPSHRIAGSDTSRELKKEKAAVKAASSSAMPNDFTPSTVYVPPKPSNHIAGSDTLRDSNKERNAAVPAASSVVPNNFSPSTVFPPPKPSQHVTGLDTSRQSKKEKDSVMAASSSPIPNYVTPSIMYVPPEPSNHIAGSDTSRESKKEKDAVKPAASSAIPNNSVASIRYVPPKPSHHIAGSDTSMESKKEKDAVVAVASSAIPYNDTPSTMVLPHKPLNHIAGFDPSRELKKEKDVASAVVRGSVGTGLAKESCWDDEVRGVRITKPNGPARQI